MTKAEEIQHTIEHLRDLEEWGKGPGFAEMGMYPNTGPLRDALVELECWRVRLSWIEQHSLKALQPEKGEAQP